MAVAPVVPVETVLERVADTPDDEAALATRPRDRSSDADAIDALDASAETGRCRPIAAVACPATSPDAETPTVTEIAPEAKVAVAPVVPTEAVLTNVADESLDAPADASSSRCAASVADAEDATTAWAARPRVREIAAVASLVDADVEDNANETSRRASELDDAAAVAWRGRSTDREAEAWVAVAPDDPVLTVLTRAADATLPASTEPERPRTRETDADVSDAPPRTPARGWRTAAAPGTRNWSHVATRA